MKNKKNTVLITLTIIITLVSIILAIMLVNSNNQLSKAHKELESVKEEKDRAVMVKDKLSTYVSNVDHDLFLEANEFVLGMNSLTSYKFGDGVLFDKTQITINEPKKQTSGMLAMEHDSNSFIPVTVTLVITNNDSSNIEINPGKMLVSDDKGNYLAYDSVITNDDTVAVQSKKSVVIRAGGKATIAIVYAMNKDNSNNDVNKIEFLNKIWTK